MSAWRVAAAAGALGLVGGVMAWRMRPATVSERVGADAQPEPDPVAAGAQAEPREPRPLAALAAWQPAPPRTRVGRAAAYAWASPMTAAGLLVGFSGGVRPHVRAGVLVFAEARGPIGALLRLRGFAATTLGHAVIAIRQPSEALFAHELMHTRQAERFGLLFGPLYIALLGVYGYTRHPMERAARLAASALTPPPA